MQFVACVSFQYRSAFAFEKGFLIEKEQLEMNELGIDRCVTFSIRGFYQTSSWLTGYERVLASFGEIWQLGLAVVNSSKSTRIEKLAKQASYSTEY